ncbi:MAG: nucleotidyltransferase domain-containing protein [Bacteroidales bacterium]|nr:nucleotidyltransferase domain-containing protein [Bacteroidales bacterium]
MRFKPEIKTFIKDTALELFPNAKVYLFGSRLDKKSRGGDIDILIISREKIEYKNLRRFRVGFYKKFGWQKIDLVNFTHDDNATFKQLVLQNAILL